jgi:hypothetical protein
MRVMTTLEQIELSKIHEHRYARARQLVPQMSILMRDAIVVYKELRPKARHVSTVPMEYPLRHQQVHAFAPDAPDGMMPVADYLMVSLGEHRSLTIYKDFGGEFESSPKWHFTRTVEIAEMTGQRTKVQETKRTLHGAGIPDYIDLDVATYTYHPEWGHNPYIGEFVCSVANAYEGAETHIAEATHDLTAALVIYS